MNLKLDSLPPFPWVLDQSDPERPRILDNDGKEVGLIKAGNARLDLERGMLQWEAAYELPAGRSAEEMYAESLNSCVRGGEFRVAINGATVSIPMVEHEGARGETYLRGRGCGLSVRYYPGRYRLKFKNVGSRDLTIGVPGGDPSKDVWLPPDGQCDSDWGAIFNG